MAITKDAVKIKFTAKFSKVNAPKTYKESLINKIAEKVKDDEDETNLDSILDLYEPVLIETAAEFDRVRTKATTDANEAARKKLDPDKKEEVVTDELPSDTPEYIKVIMKQLEANKAELASIKAEKSADSLTTRFQNDPRLKGIPAFALKGYIPKSEEELETNITELTGAYSEFAKTNKLAEIGADAPDRQGGGNQTTVTEKVAAAAIKDWGAAKVAALAPQQTVTKTV